MGAKKISQLPSIQTPSLSGITAVVDSGTTYNITLSNLKALIHDVIKDVTYSEFRNLIDTNSLVLAHHYRITDFATSYWLFDGEGNECNNGVPIVGDVEPLILFATSSNTVDIRAYSEIHHNDIIYYEWDELEFNEDEAFLGLPNFKGVITYREDTINNNSAGWDIRAVKFRRWESTAPNWLTGTTYNINDIVKHNGYIWICINQNINKDPSLISNSTDWSQLLNLTSNIHWNSNATGITFSNVFIPSGPSFFDFYSINLSAPESINNTISVTPIQLIGQKQTRLCNVIFTGISNNIKVGPNCKIITVATGSSKVDIRSGTNRVIFGINMRNIIIRTNCYRLIFSDFVSNVDFGSSCNNILLGKNNNDIILKIGSGNIKTGFNCSSLTIGPSSYNINIGTDCSKINIASESHDIKLNSNSSSIVIGDNCYDITMNLSSDIIIENSCNNIILPMNSINNRIESRVSGDLSLSSHVTQTYTCVIFRNAGGTVKLRYYDANDINQVVAINV